ncbi:conserved membrane hypothetical protein [Sphingomonas sp. EC-HK361]|uniref:M56 family metallopeptidase n=1 Tax=Sphingomonas sp. EC-HK361 TaxID=2038397 RepID=UPI001251C94D|nr:M56 family metallopeptidase [Sphingomonas sp. EC-HK361]VVT03736.1 conserved membrane hypothetical protein [Sphingomonas sp. EC-HK361]
MSALSLGWAVEALIASTVLMLLVLAIRAPARRSFGAQIAYALWALPVLRLALPPLPENWRHAVATPIAEVGQQVTILIVPAQAATSAAPTIAWGAILAACWAVGAVAFLGWHLLSYARFCRRVLERADAIDRVGRVTILATDAASGPLAFGIARRFVAFPRDFTARYDDGERALALAHELGHHQRGDLIANWVALAVLALHWFNPLAWIAYRAFRADQEMANDARVLAHLGGTERHAYACAIVKSAHGGAVAAACHLHTINDLKGRLKMLGLHRASRTRLLVGSVAVGSMTVLGLGFTASGTQAAEAVRAKVETATGVDLVAAMPLAAPVPITRSETTSQTVDVTRHGKHRRVVIVKDGKTQTYDGAEADAYLAANPDLVPPTPPVPPAPPAPGVAPLPPVPPAPPRVPEAYADIPQISSRNCSGRDGGGSREVVIHRKDGDKRMMVICTNRIEKMAAESAEMAANSKDMQRHALESALAGLTSARASITANRDMSEAQRREALAGIDTSLAEIQADIARGD